MCSERPADSRLAIVAPAVTFALGLCLTGPAASAVVESAFPLSDDQSCDPVADQVRGRERWRHQAVDAEAERHGKCPAFFAHLGGLSGAQHWLKR